MTIRKMLILTDYLILVQTDRSGVNRQGSERGENLHKVTTFDKVDKQFL